MRVLAVRQIQLPGEHRQERVRKGLGLGEPTRDRGLVGRRHRERLPGQPPPRVQRQLAAGAELHQNLPVPLRPAHRSDVREVLRRRAQHRRPADVDHLDRVLLANRLPRDDALERIEVHADEVERLDLVLVERGAVVCPVAPREDRRVDPRVQGLDPAAEQLRHLRHVLDRRRADPHLLEERSRAAARDELDVQAGQAARELLEPGLVVDGEKRPADHGISPRTTCGRSRCSAACTRARRLASSSPGCTGTRSAAITGPVSTPPST